MARVVIGVLICVYIIVVMTVSGGRRRGGDWRNRDGGVANVVIITNIARLQRSYSAW